MADLAQGHGAAPAHPPRQAAPKPAGRKLRRLACDVLFPTDAAAIGRLKRGDTVPPEDCGWVQALAPGAIDLGALDPFVAASIEKNGGLLPADEDLDAAAPLATLKAARVPVITDTAAPRAGGE